MPLFIL